MLMRLINDINAHADDCNGTAAHLKSRHRFCGHVQRIFQCSVFTLVPLRIIRSSSASSTVRNHRLGLLREPDREEPAGRSEVFAHARGGPAGGARPLLHGGQRALHSRGCGCGAGQRRALSHHLPGYRYILTALFLFCALFGKAQIFIYIQC